MITNRLDRALAGVVTIREALDVGDIEYAAQVAQELEHELSAERWPSQGDSDA
jgi:hypothetical protein